MKPERWWALMLLVVSYALMVAIVVGGALWMQREFSEAKTERCGILRVQVELLRLQSQLLGEGPPEITPEMAALLTKIRTDADQICPPD
jgi:hypothetical protein